MSNSQNPNAQVTQLKEEQKQQFYNYSPKSTRPHRKIKKQTRRRSQTKIIHNCVIFKYNGLNLERRVVSQALFNVLTKKKDNLEQIVGEIVRKSDAKALEEYFKDCLAQKYRLNNDRYLCQGVNMRWRTSFREIQQDLI